MSSPILIETYVWTEQAEGLLKVRWHLSPYSKESLSCNNGSTLTCARHKSEEPCWRIWPRKRDSSISNQNSPVIPTTPVPGSDSFTSASSLPFPALPCPPPALPHPLSEPLPALAYPSIGFGTRGTVQAFPPVHNNLYGTFATALLALAQEETRSVPYVHLVVVIFSIHCYTHRAWCKKIIEIYDAIKWGCLWLLTLDDSTAYMCSSMQHLASGQRYLSPEHSYSEHMQFITTVTKCKWIANAVIFFPPLGWQRFWWPPWSTWWKRSQGKKEMRVYLNTN